ncbi:MAG: NAD+ synthase [Kiritimatiellales bacterium]
MNDFVHSSAFGIRCAAVQMNPTVGALEANANKIISSAIAAAKSDAQLVVFPELVLCGYPPEDLILRPQFIQDCDRQIARLAKELPPEIYVVAGAPFADGTGRYNAAFIFYGGNIAGVYKKMVLPDSGIFDEQHLFDAGNRAFTFDACDIKTGIQIGEDSLELSGAALAALKKEAPEIVINLSASPYYRGKYTEREKILSGAAQKLNAPLLFCNLTGGQDELVFDGGSAAFDAHGRLTSRAPLFEEYTLSTATPEICRNISGPLEEVYTALKTGLRDYVEKNGFKKVVVAVSGGIDSALVLTLATDALGAERVAAVTMPSQYSSGATIADAEEVAARLGIEFHAIPILPVYEKFIAGLETVWENAPADLTEENLQARIRGTMIMALSNKFGWLVLTAGNKSEIATGYCTLYGDMAGGLAVIKDVPKTLVFDLCRWRNRQGAVIPESTIERPPSAELHPDQKDSDSLPPYEILDPIIKAYVEQEMSVTAMIAAGFDAAAVKKTVRLINSSEYKRRQSPPGIRITPKTFGRDRRMPLTNRYTG